MKPLIALALWLAAVPAAAQPPEKIQLALEVASVGAPADAATTLQNDIRTGLSAASDVAVIPRAAARRIVRVIVTASDGVYGVSLLVTEQYDRPTLMILGIEDDDLAERMMRLQIVNEHLGFSGRDLSEIGRRVVAALDDGLLRALRSLRKQ